MTTLTTSPAKTFTDPGSATETGAQRAIHPLLIGLLFLLPISDQTATSQPRGEIGAAEWSEDGLVRLGLDAASRHRCVHTSCPGHRPSSSSASPDIGSLRTALPPQAQEVACLVMNSDQMTRLGADFDT